MKPLNSLEVWIVKFFIGENYFLARFGEKDGQKGCYLHADGYSIIDLLNLKQEIDEMLSEHVSVHTIGFGKEEKKVVKKKVAKKKAVKKVVTQ